MSNVIAVLCQKLRDRRLTLGISQMELARRAGLHRTYISELERGACNLTIESLSKLACTLDISLSQLMAEAEAAMASVADAFSILLVEDNPADAHLIMRALNQCKTANQVNHVIDGSQAMHYLLKEGDYKAAEDPDLILLDLNLPKKSGHEVLAEIKKDEKLKNIPVVILTTSRNAADIKKTYSLHANSYIAKPINPNQFQATISKTVDYWVDCAHLPK